MRLSGCISVSIAEETGGITFLIGDLGAVKTRPVALAMGRSVEAQPFLVFGGTYRIRAARQPIGHVSELSEKY